VATVIHKLALVEAGAELGEDVRIGPFCHVGGQAKIGAGSELKAHVTIIGDTTLGAGCTVWPHAVLGGDPQSKAHQGGPTRLVIGDNCIIREFCTFNRGSDGSRGVTRVGPNGYFMTGAHIAHDCDVGAGATFANAATLGGHVDVGDFVTIGGLAAVHQFVRIGHHAMLGGLSALVGDLMPFGIAMGERARLRGLNLIGMKRSGIKLDDVRAMKQGYAALFRRGTPFAENLAALRAEPPASPLVAEMLEFFSARGKRHFCMPGAGGDRDDGDSG